MIPLLSGVNDGYAIVLGRAWPGGGKLVGAAGGAGLGVQPVDALYALVVISVSLRRTFKFEKTDVPSKLISESGRVPGAWSPLMKTTRVPSGENAGVWAC